MLKRYFGFKVKLFLHRFQVSDLPESAIIINKFSNNYFHWLTEVLPKAIYLKEFNKNISIVFPIDFHSVYQVDSLNRVGVTFEILKHHNFYFKNIIGVENFAENSGYVSKKQIENLKKHLTIEKCDNPNRIIYLTRRKADRRKVLNEDDVLKY